MEDATARWVAKVSRAGREMDEIAASIHPSAWPEALKSQREAFRKLCAGRIKPKKRSASEFARIYGSRERVEWIKGFACFAAEFVYEPCEGEIQNAHTANGGKGRKAGYDTIAPMCALHHAAYDQHRAPFDNPEVREAIKQCAAQTESAWLLLQSEDAE